MRVNDTVHVAQVKRVKGNRVTGGCFLFKCVRLCCVFVFVLRNKIVCPRMCSKAPRALTEVWCPWEMSRCLDRDGWMIGLCGTLVGEASFLWDGQGPFSSSSGLCPGCGSSFRGGLTQHSLPVPTLVFIIWGAL